MPEITPACCASSTPTIAIAGHRIPFRVCLFWAGVTFWLGNMIVHTGSYGIAELWASLSFVIELVVITTATRTVTLDRVASLYCWGGAVMGVMWLIGSAFTFFIPDPNAVSRQFLIPFMEESLKLLPVVYMVWRGRSGRSWSMGASDLMLMGAASGGGFGLVEEAYFHLHYGPTRAIDWLQLTRINGPTLTLGHSTWTALAGATLGLALLWQPRKPFNYLLGGSGLLWSIIDHSHHNYGIDRTGISVDLFNFFTGHGWLSLYFFVLAAIAAVGGDFYAVRRMLASRPQLRLQAGKPPEAYGQGKGFKDLWAFLVDRRALAYVLLRSQRASGASREKLVLRAAVLERRLLKCAPGPVSSRKPALAGAD
jgi:RsiW-degrading membrane proteinase PrsW (M82 family)